MTTNDDVQERAQKEALVDQIEHVSQDRIARITGMSRLTIIKRLKNVPVYQDDHHSIS